MKLNQTKTALVFPGQGSQVVGMGRELAERYSAARAVFDEADAILGMKFSRTMWEGPEAELNDTVNTQPALFVHSMAAFRVLSELYGGFKAAAMAGHSLGELSALTAAGSLTFDSGLKLVRRRAQLMKKAGEQNPGSMAAILNLGIPDLERVCAAASAAGETVQVANDNSPGQVVISGAKTAVARALEGAKAAGAKRAIPLAVSIAAHSELMASIQDEWNAAVRAAGLVVPTVPVIGNVSAKPLTTAAEAENDICSQMQSRVRWTETIQLLDREGIRQFGEVGTGGVLLGLIRRIAPDATGFPLGKPEDFEALE